MTDMHVVAGHGQHTPERLVDRAELAQILGVSVKTVDRMVHDGHIPSITYGRRMRRFRASVVIAHLAQFEVGVNTKGEAA